ncbi:MAG: LysR family transcriptional regulator [Sporolactobacillus sp.]|jgi:DNA-binding transcriptional LysR family regulator|nr:LysR family transcriptional regulator [Sporolactobacillus sp.]
MELRTIYTFYLIVKSGSFQSAAKRLNYSQPTVSMRIKQLEEDLGITLFHRGKALKLTQAGRLFYKRAEQLLSQYEVLDNTISDLRKGEAGIINVGISEPTASLVFPKILAGFLNDFPHMIVNVKVHDANTCSQCLKDGIIDFAICGEPEIKLENVYKPFFLDTFNALVSVKNPLSKKSSVCIKDLAGETFIFTGENCPARIQVEQELRKVIGENYRKIEVSSSLSHKYYVKENIGISIFTGTAHTEYVEGTKVMPISDLQVTPPIGLLTNKRNNYLNRATLALIDRIVSHFREKSKRIIKQKNNTLQQTPEMLPS